MSKNTSMYNNKYDAKTLKGTRYFGGHRLKKAKQAVYKVGTTLFLVRRDRNH